MKTPQNSGVFFLRQHFAGADQPLNEGHRIIVYVATQSNWSKRQMIAKNIIDLETVGFLINSVAPVITARIKQTTNSGFIIVTSSAGAKYPA